MDGLMADALAEKLDDIERIDHLATIVESRRNASLPRSSGVGRSSAKRATKRARNRGRRI
jgi:hypothetical protein